MGLSSNARLLSITARLTSNEYESQQISNAKMRLATQSEEASTEYISALNTQQLLYSTYDAKGNAISTTLTANTLYQYNDLKNQYILTNASGKALITNEDATNFEASNNLNEFLKKYGIEKEWKSSTLEENCNKLESEEYQGYKKAWDDAVKVAENATYGGKSSEKAWEDERATAMIEYETAVKNYNSAYDNYISDPEGYITVTENGEQKNETYLDTFEKRKEELAVAQAKYNSCLSYSTWVQTQAALTNMDANSNQDYTPAYPSTAEDTKYSGVYEKMVNYYNVALNEFNDELEDYATLADAYSYNDTEKAQWYTNLWYKLNGESTEKSKQGSEQANYTALDSRLLNSSTWIQDALTQGAISIEVASYTETANEVPDSNNPTVVNLKGISWTSSIYSSLTDITVGDDDQAIAKAEAEYERKTQEINAKDEKYENKIKNLDTEHSALQTEYESVQSALNKNIERSFKTFNG